MLYTYTSWPYYIGGTSKFPRSFLARDDWSIAARVPENMRPFWFTGGRPRARWKSRSGYGPAGWMAPPEGGAERADSEALSGRPTAPRPLRTRTNAYRGRGRRARTHKGQRKVKRRTHGARRRCGGGRAGRDAVWYSSRRHAV